MSTLLCGSHRLVSIPFVIQPWVGSTRRETPNIALPPLGRSLAPTLLRICGRTELFQGFYSALLFAGLSELARTRCGHLATLRDAASRISVEDKGMSAPVRNVHAGGERSTSRAAIVSGTREWENAPAASDDRALKCQPGRSTTAMGSI